MIDGPIALKNNDHGAWARDGDIIFHSSGYVTVLSFPPQQT